MLLLNWRLIMLITSGIVMLGGSLWIARASVDAHFPTRDALPNAVHIAEYGKETATYEAIIQQLFQPAGRQSDPLSQHDERMSSDDDRLFNAPASTLLVQITGIISSNQPQRSLLILQSNGRQLSLSPGQHLPESDAELIRIFPDRAIIYHHGKYASLTMAE